MSICRRSFAFSHSASRQNQQQPVEDIETGQLSSAEQRAEDDCSPRNAVVSRGITTASSAPNATQHTVQSTTDSSVSPSQLDTCPSALSAGAISPPSTPNAQVSSAGMLGKLLSVGGRSMKRSASGSQPVCLICLENLTPEDFDVSTAFAPPFMFAVIASYNMLLMCCKSYVPEDLAQVYKSAWYCKAKVTCSVRPASHAGWRGHSA